MTGMDLTYKETYALVQDTILQMPEEQQVKIKEAYKDLRENFESKYDEGIAALAMGLRCAEVAAEN
mgnify:CR=1 FL=1